ncbi:MAG: hypothetical protein Q4C61_11415 [Lachnospiraceae bacterium]|nr:hypothetical protein [Lachnospiraceae bacterium]
MALSTQDLQAISEIMDIKIQPINERLDKMDERIDQIDGRIDQMDVRLDKMDERLDNIEFAVSRNYDLTLEFYASQKEFNNEFREHLHKIDGRLEMHDNQIAKNTADIRYLKRLNHLNSY